MTDPTPLARAAADPPAPAPRFEDLLRELEQVVGALEGGRLDLEASLAAFERGTRLAKEAGTILERAQSRVEQILAAEDGSVREVPFPTEP